MTSAVDAVQRYRHEYATFVEAAREAETLLAEVCRRAGVLGRIEGREKSVVSFVKKTRIKADKYTDFWGQIEDKVGGRVILSTTADRRRTVDALVAATDLFPIIGEPDDKSQGIKPESLAYPGIHVDVQLPRPVLSDGEVIHCEVQVRTQAEDLWAVPSHKFLYKPTVPAPWMAARRLWRLRTFVEVFDEEVERAMAEVSREPGEVAGRLLHIAEGEYYRFVGVAGEDELSVKAPIVGSCPPRRLAGLPGRAARFRR